MSFSILSQDQPDVRPPHALLYLTALLIKHDLLELSDIYLHVSTSWDIYCN